MVSVEEPPPLGADFQPASQILEGVHTLRIVTSPTLEGSWLRPVSTPDPDCHHSIPGPKPAGISSPWLWGGLCAYVYQMRQENAPYNYAALIPLAAVCGIAFYRDEIMDESADDTPLAIAIFVLWFSVIPALWIGHFRMSYKVKELIHELEGPLRAQGWSFVLQKDWNFFTGWYVVELKKITDFPQEPPCTQLLPPLIEALRPHTFEHGWKWPDTSINVWTLGFVFSTMEQLQEASNASLKNSGCSVFSVLMILCWIDQVERLIGGAPLWVKMAIRSMIILIGMTWLLSHFRRVHREMHPVNERALEEINPLMLERTGYTIALETKATCCGYLPTHYLRFLHTPRAITTTPSMV